MFSVCVCVCVCMCVHVDFLFFFLPEMVNKVEYISNFLGFYKVMYVVQYLLIDIHLIS